MTNKDKCLIIVNKLFEICEQDFSVSFSGHCGEMVVDFKNDGEGQHFHISDHKDFTGQLDEMIQAVYSIETFQKENNDSDKTRKRRS